jgi:hypothetical protein
MTNYRVVLEIEIDADSPLEAAKAAQEWIQEKDTNWHYYVQRTFGGEIFSVALDEEDEDAVIKIHNYISLINNS